jgi:tetratricopeptide (TPR) repeat protein
MKKIVIAGGVLIVVLGLMILTPFGGILHSLWYIKKIESAMKKPAVYEPVGRMLALYCQSEPELFPEYFGEAWFPKELRELGEDGHGWISHTRKLATIEMGGGFYHYGYRLEQDDDASTPTTNVWQLSMYTEETYPSPLTTITLPSTHQISSQELVVNLSEGFDDLLSQHPDSDTLHKGKVLMLLRFQEFSAAAETSRHWIALKPHNWLPQFTYAHLRARLGELQEADEGFLAWVQQHESFDHYLYLFFFNMREGRISAALDAIRSALQQPYTSGGYSAASFAFLHEEYSLCIAVCEKILADEGVRDSWQQYALQLKVSAFLMQGEQQEAIKMLEEEWLPKEVANPTVTQQNGEDTDAYFAAIQSNDTEFIRNYHRETIQQQEWFSPFKTDETWIYGRDDIPDPYPGDWKKQAGL